MSSPANPLAPGPADAVAPVERERHWWTPIALAIDRWLQPRWRALLTWVVVTTITGGLFDYDAVRWIAMHGVGFIVLQVSGPGPPEISYFLTFAFGIGIPAMFLIIGFPPVAMKLPRKNFLLWLLTVPLFGAVVFIGIGIGAFGFRHEGTGPGIAAGIVGSASGLTLLGARSRPWLTLVAGPLAGSFVVSVPFGEGWFWLVGGGMNLIYGAVMLYGTSPLPRKEGGA